MAMNLEPDKSTGTSLKVACSQCKCDTNHIVLKSIEASGSSGGDDPYFWDTSYQIIQCLGCDAVSFCSLSTNSEDMDPTASGDWERAEFESLIPKPNGGPPASSRLLHTSKQA